MEDNRATLQTLPELQQEIDAINAVVKDTIAQNQRAVKTAAEEKTLRNELLIAWHRTPTTNDKLEIGYKFPVYVPWTQRRHDVLQFSVFGNVKLVALDMAQLTRFRRDPTDASLAKHTIVFSDGMVEGQSFYNPGSLVSVFFSDSQIFVLSDHNDELVTIPINTLPLNYEFNWFFLFSEMNFVPIVSVGMVVDDQATYQIKYPAQVVGNSGTPVPDQTGNVVSYTNALGYTVLSVGVWKPSSLFVIRDIVGECSFGVANSFSAPYDDAVFQSASNWEVRINVVMGMG